MNIKDEVYYQTEIERLKNIIGSYRREIQEKHCQRKSVKSGYDSDRNLEYHVYLVRGIPKDAPLTEVVKNIREWFMKLPEMQGFRFQKVDYSRKATGWYVQVCRTAYM